MLIIHKISVCRLFFIFIRRLLAQTTLRNILGTKNLHEILSDRESISSSMQVKMMMVMMMIMILKCKDEMTAHCRVFSTKPQLPGGSKWRGSRCEIVFQSALPSSSLSASSSSSSSSLSKWRGWRCELAFPSLITLVISVIFIVILIIIVIITIIVIIVIIVIIIII